MKSRLALILLPPALCGTVFFMRGKEYASLRSELAGARVAAHSIPARKGGAVTDDLHSKPVHEQLCRVLAEGGNLGPEEALLLLKLADPPDAGLLHALAKTATTLSMEPGQRRNLIRLIEALTKPLPDDEAAPVLLTLFSIQGRIPDGLKRRFESWTHSAPAAFADWLERRMADGSFRSYSSPDQEGYATLIGPLRLIADPVANLERIRASDRSMQRFLFTEGLLHTKSAADRRNFAAAALTLPKPCAVPEMLAALVKEGGMGNTGAWLGQLPGMEPSARESAMATLATAIPGHTDIADNATRIFSRLDPSLHGDFAAALTGVWAEKDHEAAARWINSSPGTPWQDRAREGFARHIAGNGEHGNALVWADSIADAARRSAVTQSLFDTWRQRDPEEASRFLQSPECPEGLARTLNARQHGN